MASMSESDMLYKIQTAAYKRPYTAKAVTTDVKQASDFLKYYH